jgi:glycosyltransferase involved in cell wall biosynthesis
MLAAVDRAIGFSDTNRRPVPGFMSKTLAIRAFADSGIATERMGINQTSEMTFAKDIGLNAEPEISVVIPCLNEAQSLAACIDSAFAALRSMEIFGEVVVADNGSTDGSVEIAERHGARVVHAQIKGYGSAVRTGIQAARGAFIVTGDSDGSHDFSEIPRFVAKWREGYEFIMGSRILGEIKDDAMRWHHRRIGTPVLSGLVSLFFGTRVTDINTGMRGMTKELANHLDFRTNGFEMCSESLIKAALAGAKIAEVPITTWPEQRERPPHLSTFRDGWKHLRLIMLSAPNWLFLLPGGFLITLGVGIVGWLLPGPALAGKVELDTRTISLAMMLVLLGMHVFSIGLFVKVFCYTERLSRGQRGLVRWLRRVRLEHGLLLGAGLTCMGIIGDGIILGQWAHAGFGLLHAIRAVFFFSLSLFLGIEVIFSSIFLSMLGISRDTYIGE